MIIDSNVVVRYDTDKIQPILNTIKTVRTIFAGVIWGLMMNSCHPQMNTNWYLQDISSASITDQERAGNKKFFEEFKDEAELLRYIYKNTKDLTISEVQRIDEHVAEIEELKETNNAINSTEQEMLASKQEILRLEKEEATRLNSKKEEKSWIVKVLDKAAGTIALAFAWIITLSPEILGPKKKRKRNSIPRVARREEDITSPGNQKTIRTTWTPDSPQELEPTISAVEFPIRRYAGSREYWDKTPLVIPRVEPKKIKLKEVVNIWWASRNKSIEKEQRIEKHLSRLEYILEIAWTRENEIQRFKNRLKSQSGEIILELETTLKSCTKFEDIVRNYIIYSLGETPEDIKKNKLDQINELVRIITKNKISKWIDAHKQPSIAA